MVGEGWREPIPKRGFYVRRPHVMTWRMNAGGGRKAGPQLLDGWGADADAAGLTPVQEISVAIEDARVLVAGQPPGERLGLIVRAPALARLPIRSPAPEGHDA